ncbi:hypothetical protein [Streptomyces sp. NPDC050263]|uniref:hypothetical protein n=1 Tax=Streptomyces sp. NPDC050263 TaxID=3155037 RepID=UPI0034314049
MGLFRSKPDATPESTGLAAARAALPQSVADWTSEQRRRYADQSDRAMREQNGVAQPGEQN